MGLALVLLLASACYLFPVYLFDEVPAASTFGGFKFWFVLLGLFLLLSGTKRRFLTLPIVATVLLCAAATTVVMSQRVHFFESSLDMPFAISAREAEIVLASSDERLSAFRRAITEAPALGVSNLLSVGRVAFGWAIALTGLLYLLHALSLLLYFLLDIGSVRKTTLA
jgi:hypothetical protein